MVTFACPSPLCSFQFSLPLLSLRNVVSFHANYFYNSFCDAESLSIYILSPSVMPNFLSSNLVELITGVKNVLVVSHLPEFDLVWQSNFNIMIMFHVKKQLFKLKIILLVKVVFAPWSVRTRQFNYLCGKLGISLWIINNFRGFNEKQLREYYKVKKREWK